MKMRHTRRSSYIASLFILLALIGFISCQNITDDILNGGGDFVVGKIMLHQTGGIAGISRIITIAEKDDSILLTSINDVTHQTSEIQISEEDLEHLWQILETNDVFTLPSNDKLVNTVADGFSYEITVERGKKRNQFSVYAPGELASQNGEKRYSAIIDAIQRLANSDQFIIDDLPINDITIQVMESFPMQVAIVVDGYLRDGCTELDQITQRREENTIYVHITTKRPKDAICIQVIKNIQERIQLEGGFLPGDYEVIVNGVKKEFHL